MKLYRLHVKPGEESPEDWGRVLVPFAGTGLRLREEFTHDCVIEAGPLLIQEIMGHLRDYVECYDYDPAERETVARYSKGENTL